MRIHPTHPPVYASEPSTFTAAGPGKHVVELWWKMMDEQQSDAAGTSISYCCAL